MCSAYKLNNQGDNIHILMYLFPSFEPVHFSMSGSNGCFLISIQASKGQVRQSGIPNSLSICHSWVVIHTKALVSSVKQKQMFFLAFPCFFYDPMDMSILIFGTSVFSKSNLYIWKFSVHVLLEPNLKDFEHALLACEMSEIVWQFGNSLALPL